MLADVEAGRNRTNNSGERCCRAVLLLALSVRVRAGAPSRRARAACPADCSLTRGLSLWGYAHREVCTVVRVLPPGRSRQSGFLL